MKIVVARYFGAELKKRTLVTDDDIAPGEESVTGIGRRGDEDLDGYDLDETIRRRRAPRVLVPDAVPPAFG
ncbi:MAG: hypothetical protein ACLPLP_24880 [Mycobacterium sp.]